MCSVNWQANGWGLFPWQTTDGMDKANVNIPQIHTYHLHYREYALRS